MAAGNSGRYYNPGDQSQRQGSDAQDQRRRSNPFGRGGPFDRRRFHENNTEPPRYRRSGSDPRHQAKPSGRGSDWRNHVNDAGNNPGFHMKKNEPMLVDRDHDERGYRNQDSHRSSRGRGRGLTPGGIREGRYSNMRQDGVMRNRDDGRSDKELEEDEGGWGPKRRQRGYVPNGKIEKRQRIDEFELKNEPYCDVCDIWFRNVSEKIAHIRAKSHNDMVYTQRGERLEKQLFDLQKGGPTSEQAQPQNQTSVQGTPLVPLNLATAMETASVDAQNVNAQANDSATHDYDVVDPDVQRLLTDDVRMVGSMEVPSSFKSWAHKSLKAADERSKTNKDPQLVDLVKKEITYELIRHSKACTLHRINWSRAPFATGQSVKSRKNLLPSFSLAQIRAMDERAIPEENENGNVKKRDDAVEVEEKPSGELSVHTQPTLASFAEDRHWIRGADLELNAHMSGEGSILASEQMVASFSTDATNALSTCADQITSDVPGPSADDNGSGAQTKLFRQRKQHRCRSDRARTLVNGLVFLSFDAVCRRHYEITQGPPESNKVGDLIIKGLHELSNNVVSGNYECKSAWSNLHKIVSQLESSGAHRRMVRKGLKLQMDISVDNRDFRNLGIHAGKLMRIVDECDCVDEAGTDLYVGYWFLSLLFKETLSIRTAVKVNRPSASRLLAMALRQIPKNSLRNTMIYEMKETFSALLTNNWVRFFQFMRCGLLHTVSDGKSLGICTAYVDFMRERALMTMFRANNHNDNVYYLPPALPLNFVMRVLGFGDVRNCTNDEGKDKKSQTACKFVMSLPQKIEVENNDDDQHSISLMTGSEKAAIRDSEVVHVELLLDKLGRTMSLIKLT